MMRMTPRKIMAYHRQIARLQSARMLEMAEAFRAAQSSNEQWAAWVREKQEVANPSQRKVITGDAVASFIKGLGRR